MLSWNATLIGEERKNRYNPIRFSCIPIERPINQSHYVLDFVLKKVGNFIARLLTNITSVTLVVNLDFKNNYTETT